MCFETNQNKTTTNRNTQQKQVHTFREAKRKQNDKKRKCQGGFCFDTGIFSHVFMANNSHKQQNNNDSKTTKQLEFVNIFQQTCIHIFDNTHKKEIATPHFFSFTCEAVPAPKDCFSPSTKIEGTRTSPKN